MDQPVRPPTTTRHLDRIRAFASGEAAPPPIALLRGYVGTRVEIGSVDLELDVDERHHNQMGTVAGGVIADLCDAAIGIAMATTIEDDEGFTVLDLTTKFLKAVPEARLRASARVVKRTRTLGLVECGIFDPDHALLAKAFGSCIVLR
jgi:uncharacterized protein (TIGR00369 family)